MKGKSTWKWLLAVLVLLGLIGWFVMDARVEQKTETGQERSSERTAESRKENETNSEDGMRTILDMAGREVTIPRDVKKVYCAVPTGEAMIAALCPEKLCGWVNKVSDKSMRYLNEDLKKLPLLGGWMGQRVTANIESIIKAAPDVIIYATDRLNLGTKNDRPDNIQAKTGIPVVAVADELAGTPKAFRFLGDILSSEERGEKLAAYCEEKLAMIGEAVAKIPEDKIVSIYYAEGKGGLATDPSTSEHVAVLDFVRTRNVADVEKRWGMGMTEVSFEQVLNWNPDVILVSATTDSNYDLILKSDTWKEINAVKNGRVYLTPRSPFNWFDRPPNAMRVLGVQWFAKLMYPEYVDLDVRAAMKEFFELFYLVELTDADVDSLIAPNPLP